MIPPVCTPKLSKGAIYNLISKLETYKFKNAKDKKI